MMNETHNSAQTETASDDRLRFDKNVTKAVYALQAASFLFGITLIAAVIVNYIKRDDVKGTWLGSHFRWQIRTFWFVFLWMVLGIVTYRMEIGVIIVSADAVWFLYRILKGWISLTSGKEMYASRSN